MKSYWQRSELSLAQKHTGLLSTLRLISDVGWCSMYWASSVSLDRACAQHDSAYAGNCDMLHVPSWHGVTGGVALASECVLGI